MKKHTFKNIVLGLLALLLFCGAAWLTYDRYVDRSRW